MIEIVRQPVEAAPRRLTKVWKIGRPRRPIVLHSVDLIEEIMAANPEWVAAIEREQRLRRIARSLIGPRKRRKLKKR